MRAAEAKISFQQWKQRQLRAKRTGIRTSPSRPFGVRSPRSSNRDTQIQSHSEAQKTKQINNLTRQNQERSGKIRNTDGYDIVV